MNIYKKVNVCRGAHGGGGGGVPAVAGERDVRDHVAGLPRGHVQRRDRGRARARHQQPHQDVAPHRPERGPAGDHSRRSRGTLDKLYTMLHS